MPDSIHTLLTTRRVVVCCGSGGVGKTTTAAAVALRAAAEGRRAVVITIDPARRLATSLGLESLSHSAADLTAKVNEALKAAGQKTLAGELHAVMPDTAQTFERFVRSMAGEDEGLARRVLRTSIYKVFAREFSGANEYMAMERLHELYHEGNYDLVVLDTPPSGNTRVFLEAPHLLAEFFDDRVIRWFVAPGSRLLAGGIRKLLEILERLTGHGFIAELIEFTGALFELRAQFIENLRMVGRLLHQDDVSFLMVTTPERLSKPDTEAFVDLLHDRGYHFWGVVVNRVLSRRLGLSRRPHPSPDDLAADLGRSSKAAPEEFEILAKSFERLMPALEHERDCARFLARVAGVVWQVSEQREDVHSVAALLGVSRELGS